MATFRVFRLKRYEATIEAKDAYEAYDAAHDLRDGWRCDSDSISEQVMALDNTLFSVNRGEDDAGP